MSLSKLQQTYLDNCNHRWNFKTGATGSGKSYLDYLAVIPLRMLALKGEGSCLMLGNTQQTLNRNVLEPMRNIWGEKLVSQIHYDNSIDCFGRKVYVLGADKITSTDKIRGMTIEYAYGDEMTTWNQDVFEMLKSRLRCEHSVFDGTMNPTDPSNFMKEFIDSDADIYCQTSTIDDNPFLPPDFVENLKKEYAGTVYYNRYILGQWAYAEGIIYRQFADAVQSKDNRFLYVVDEDRKPIFYKIIIGVDFGGNGSKHAFVATGITTNGNVIGLASRRIEPSDADALTREFKNFAEMVFSTWGEIYAVYCDSAEQVLIQQIRNHLLRTNMAWLSQRVWNAKKTEINDRIRLTSILMGGGRFFYMPTSETLKTALATCMWSDKKVGVDERLDDGSTDIDTLDAFEYTIERERGRLLRWS